MMRLCVPFKQTFNNYLRVALLSALMVCGINYNANAVTWAATATSTGPWVTGSNWTGGAAPTSGAAVAFNPAAGATLTINNVGPTVTTYGALTAGNANTGTTVFGFSNNPTLTFTSITCTGNLNSSNANLVTTGGGSVSASRTLTIGAGRTFSITGTFTVAGTLAGTGTITVKSGGILIFSGTSPVIPANVIVDAGGEIRCTNSGSVTGMSGTSSVISGTFTLGGTTSTATGFNADWGTGSTLVYSGTGAQTANYYELPGSNGPTNVTINNSSGVSFSSSISPSPTIAGTLTLTNGILNIAGSTSTVTFTGNTPIARGSGSMSVTGAFASIVFAPASGNVTIPASTFNNTTITKLVMNMGSGTGVLTMNAQNLTISTLVLTKGLLTLGTGNIATSSFSGSSTFSTTNMVTTSSTSGLLFYKFPVGASSTITYPLGETVTTTEYTPVTFTMASNSDTCAVGFKVVDANDPNIAVPSAAADYLSRYWPSSITANAGTYAYDATFAYNGTSGDITGTEANLAPVRYTGANWANIPGSVNAAGNYLQVSGATETSAPLGTDITGRTAGCNPLSGTFTIGGSSPDYATFNAAVTAIANCGINGPVLFNVRTGTYTEQVVVPAISGSSAANTITFTAESGNAADVTLQSSSNASATNYVVQLNGCSYVTFNSLTINYTGSSVSYGRVFWFGPATTNSILNNCILNGKTASANAGLELVYSSNLSTTVGSNNTISNNKLNNGSYGIYYVGKSATPETGQQFFGNTLYNQYNNALNIQYLYAPKVFNNIIYSPASTNDGINVSNCSGAAGNLGLVYNNSVSTTGDAINTLSNTYLGIYYNVAQSSGTNLSTYAAFRSSNTNNISVQNNIFVNSGTGYATYNSTSTPLVASDYNDYYSANGTTVNKYIGYWSGNMARMADLKFNAGSFESHSAGINPQVTLNATTHRLVVGYTGFANKGIPVTGITTDFDGNARNGSTPDIGAYEGTATTHAALAGSYTVGGSSPNYASVYDATEELNFFGVSAPVTFNLRNATYVEQISIGAVNGASSSTAVTYQSASGDSSQVIVQYSSSLSNANEHYTVRLLEASYIKFSKLTLQATNATNGRVVVFDGGANNNTITNSQILGVTSTTNTNVKANIYSASVTGGINNTNTISNNLINQGSYGISLNGASTSALESGNIISGNTFTNQSHYGVDLSNQNAPQVIGNKITTTSTYGPYYGISTAYSQNAQKIQRNEIYTNTTYGYGIDAEYCSGTTSLRGEISNNMIAIGTGAAHTNNYGILVNVSPYQNVWYNTARTNSSYATLENNCAFKAYNTNTALNVQNNIFVNRGAGLAVDITASASINIMNNNNLFTAGTKMGYRNGAATSANTLTSWQTLSGSAWDMNSQSIDPETNFASTSTPFDLRLATTNPALVNGAVLALTTDIDNRPRSATKPVMGAYEGVSCVTPTITGVSASPTCSGVAGTISLSGLVPNITGLQVTYSIGGIAQPSVTVNSDASGNASFTNLLTSLLNGLLLEVTQITNGSCNASFSGVGSSLVVSDNTWTGATSTDWFTASNWSCGVIPTVSSNVIIPSANITNFPVVAGGAAPTALSHDITIASGATVNVGGVLEVHGNFANAGSPTLGNGKVSFISTTAQTISGINNFKDLQINNSNGVSFTSGAQKVSNILTLQSGTLTTNSLLTIASTSAGTGLVDNFSTGNTGTIAGNLTVERYAENPNTNFYYIGAPVSGATFADWANDFNMGTLNGATDGAQVIPTSSCSLTNLAANSPYGGLFEYVESDVTNCLLKGWHVRTTSGLTIPLGKGFAGRVPNGTTVRLTGGFVTGTVTSPLLTTTSANTVSKGFNLLANPYASPIDWSRVAAANTGISGTAAVYQNAGTYAGTYLYLNGIAGSGEIGSSEAIFVEAINPLTTVTFTNSMRATGNNAFLRTSRPYDNLLTLDVAGNGFSDKLRIAFGSNFTTNFDREFDAHKLRNAEGQPSLFATAGAEEFAIYAEPTVLDAKDVNVSLEPGVAGEYTITANDLGTFDANQTIVLEDRKLNVMQNLVAKPSYTFTADANDNAARFVVHFSAKTDSTTGISNAGSSNVTVNSYDNNVSIRFTNFSAPEKVTMNIYDLTGRKVIASQELTTGTSTHQINMGDVVSGYYFVVMTGDNYEKAEKVFLTSTK